MVNFEADGYGVLDKLCLREISLDKNQAASMCSFAVEVVFVVTGNTIWSVYVCIFPQSITL